MRTIFLIVGVAVLASCNSGTKTEVKVDGKQYEWDTTYPGTKDTASAPTPAGKTDIETFGDIKLGQASAETIKVLGEPDSKAEAIEWAADGLMHQDWTWKAKGLVLNMSYDKTKQESTTAIYTITAQAPCAFKTKAGLGIGNTYSEVEAAYKKDIDPEATDKTQITVGSVYGGIIFSFTNDKASTIFLGAQAE
ncbi:MAG: hypothetical protein HOP10_12340 [Chitinophagaceae bacterium]|nr:hypothetical protein [Chitinophagaceae bacterium]